jgi:hypothetical protein
MSQKSNELVEKDSQGDAGSFWWGNRTRHIANQFASGVMPRVFFLIFFSWPPVILSAHTASLGSHIGIRLL